MGKFHIRIQTIQKIIKENSPDLISLQEIRSADHLEKLFSKLEDYTFYPKPHFLLSYADPAFAFKKSLFQLLDQGSFWLGPKDGQFSFGWKPALPRMLRWVKLYSIKKDKTFYLVTTHLDNRIENLEGSATQIRKFIEEKNLPVIFAADTNITKEMPQYKLLMGTSLINGFDEFQKTALSKNDSYKREFCYLKKGKIFPDCMVEHILFSNNLKWKIKDFKVDLTTMPDGKSFPSDHRPFFIVFDFL